MPLLLLKFKLNSLDTLKKKLSQNSKLKEEELIHYLKTNKSILHQPTVMKWLEEHGYLETMGERALVEDFVCRKLLYKQFIKVRSFKQAFKALDGIPNVDI